MEKLNEIPKLRVNLPHLEIIYEFVTGVDRDNGLVKEVSGKIFVRTAQVHYDSEAMQPAGFSFVVSKVFAKDIKEDEVEKSLVAAREWLNQERTAYANAPCNNHRDGYGDYSCPKCGWEIHNYDGPTRLKVDMDAPSDDIPLLRISDHTFLYDGVERWTEHWKCPDCGMEFECENGT